MAGPSQSVTTQPEGRADALPPLDNITRLKMARGILDQTVDAVGAGYLLVMFVPGSDVVLRSFKGLDTAEECAAMVAEVGGMMNQKIGQLKAGTPAPKHNAS